MVSNVVLYIALFAGRLICMVDLMLPSEFSACDSTDNPSSSPCLLSTDTQSTWSSVRCLGKHLRNSSLISCMASCTTRRIQMDCSSARTTVPHRALHRVGREISSKLAANLPKINSLLQIPYVLRRESAPLKQYRSNFQEPFRRKAVSMYNEAILVSWRMSCPEDFRRGSGTVWYNTVMASGSFYPGYRSSDPKSAKRKFRSCLSVDATARDKN